MVAAIHQVGGQGGQARRRVGLDLKVDTGMHRLGVNPREVTGLVDAIVSDPGLELRAMMTDFATADDDPDYMERQLEVFEARSARRGSVSPEYAFTRPFRGSVPQRTDAFDLRALATYGMALSTGILGNMDYRPVTFQLRGGLARPGAR